MTRFALKTYVDADKHLRNWFVFGEHPDGTVDVADSEGDVLTGVSRADAERLMAARDAFVAAVCEILKPT